MTTQYSRNCTASSTFYILQAASVCPSVQRHPGQNFPQGNLSVACQPPSESNAIRSSHIHTPFHDSPPPDRGLNSASTKSSGLYKNRREKAYLKADCTFGVRMAHTKSVCSFAAWASGSMGYWASQGLNVWECIFGLGSES